MVSHSSATQIYFPGGSLFNGYWRAPGDTASGQIDTTVYGRRREVIRPYENDGDLKRRVESR